MIDRIRQDIQERLEQLLSEAERLREALAALGSERRDSAARPAASARTTSRSRSRSRSTARASAGTTSAGTTSAGTTSAAPTATRTRTRRTRTSAAGAPGSSTAGSRRAAAGGTKNAVLEALGAADGKALTASEVAAATGLGRASVSTTLSKLARSGEVTKADRGYRVGGGAPASGQAPAAAGNQS
jgi:CRP-like cAMP-binding protein